MSTIKKFIKYYAPYKGVFFFDLFCAAVISIVDLMYPQILRTSINTLFTRDAGTIVRALIPISRGAAFYVYRAEPVSVLRELSRAYDGSENGAGYAPGAVRPL